jgi:hypothetical protein
MLGAFPPDALIRPNGDSVEPLDVYLSYLAMAQTGDAFSPTIRLGAWSLGNTNDLWGARLLRDIIIALPDVLKFCEHTQTLPPPGLVGRWQRRRLRGHLHHLAPPYCEGAEREAIRRNERLHAIAMMNTAQSHLAGLQGKPGRHLYSRDLKEPLDVQFWRDRWNEDRTRIAKHMQSAAGSDELQTRLAALAYDWATFLASEEAQNESRKASPDAHIPAEEGELSPATPATGRRGRPLNSGSYKELDAPLVEEMHRARTDNPALSAHAAALDVAPRAKGGGILASKVRRLMKRYSEKFHSGS